MYVGYLELRWVYDLFVEGEFYLVSSERFVVFKKFEIVVEIFFCYGLFFIL